MVPLTISTPAEPAQGPCHLTWLLRGAMQTWQMQTSLVTAGAGMLMRDLLREVCLWWPLS